MEQRANPLNPGALSAALYEMAATHGVPAARTMVALTGGEPLLQHAFLHAWLPTWEGPVMLETAGIYADRLQALLPEIDALSLDWKMNADLDQGADLNAAAECIEVAESARRDRALDYWCKLVVSAATPARAVLDACSQIAALAPGCRVLLQPVTPLASAVAGGPTNESAAAPRGAALAAGPALQPPCAQTLLAYLAAAQDLDLDLRVVPQVHPLLGAR